MLLHLSPIVSWQDMEEVEVVEEVVEEVVVVLEVVGVVMMEVDPLRKQFQGLQELTIQFMQRFQILDFHAMDR